MRHRWIAIMVLAVLGLGLCWAAYAQEETGGKVTVFIFEARIRSFAPGIEAAITLTDEQKKQLAGAYNEAFGTNPVRLANLILVDNGASVAQRQLAMATVGQAQADFRAKSRAIFTEEQRGTIDKVYEAFNRVYQAAQQALSAEVTKGFAAELGKILTEEQKKAVEARKAELEAATTKPPETKPAEAEAGGGTKPQ